MTRDMGQGTVPASGSFHPTHPLACARPFCKRPGPHQVSYARWPARPDHVRSGPAQHRYGYLTLEIRSMRYRHEKTTENHQLTVIHLGLLRDESTPGILQCFLEVRQDHVEYRCNSDTASECSGLEQLERCRADE